VGYGIDFGCGIGSKGKYATLPWFRMDLIEEMSKATVKTHNGARNHLVLPSLSWLVDTMSVVGLDFHESDTLS